MPTLPAAARLNALLAVTATATLVTGLPAAAQKPAAPPPVDVVALSASELADGLCRGQYTSVAVVDAYLERIAGHQNLNAFITVDADGARKAAAASDAARKPGSPCLPLAGVPIVVKDNIAVAGLPTTAGTPALKNYRPAADAPVVARLKAAGAIVLGKTHMHELAFGISGFNPAWQTGPEVGVRNAHDPTRSAGGSSSGTGAAIGARLAPAGLGTDTGGSVRVPCAFNGCASLRPTLGRYPGDGIVPISRHRDTAGPMAVAMSDVERLDRVVTGAAPVTAADLGGVRLGRVAALFADLDADTQAVTEAALTRLKAAGVTVVDVDWPDLLPLSDRIGFPLALYDAYDDLSAWLAASGTGIDLKTLAAGIASPDVKGTFDALVLPRKLPAANGLVDAAPVYKKAMEVDRPALEQAYARVFASQRLDALVFPTVPRVAMAANAEASGPAVFGTVIRNTDPGSNAGIPGLQLPAGMGSASGLPVGLELDGPADSDRRLIAIGLAAEAVLGRAPAGR